MALLIAPLQPFLWSWWSEWLCVISSSSIVHYDGQLLLRWSCSCLLLHHITKVRLGVNHRVDACMYLSSDLIQMSRANMFHQVFQFSLLIESVGTTCLRRLLGTQLTELGKTLIVSEAWAWMEGREAHLFWCLQLWIKFYMWDHESHALCCFYTNHDGYPVANTYFI